MNAPTPEVINKVRGLVQPAMRAVIDGLEDEQMRLIAEYQMGWVDADGEPTDSGGKAIRPTLTVVGALAAGGLGEDALPAAVAVELIHNFSLLHDDVMDRDVERRHRATGWVVFGEGQAILAGNAMLTAALEGLVNGGVPGMRSLPGILTATQRVISGQSQDLLLERRDRVTLDEVLSMEAGKTAALLACAASAGAVSVGAEEVVVAGLANFGHEVGVAFQLVDDVLGVIGDPQNTGKSSSSDVRAGKRSSTITAALNAGTAASHRLEELLRAGPPTTEENVQLATTLIVDAGGVEWAMNEADARLASALSQLHRLHLPDQAAVGDLVALAEYIVNRDR